MRVTLNRQITFRTNLENTTAKIRSPTSITQILEKVHHEELLYIHTKNLSAGTSLLSAAEYVALIWGNSAYSGKIDPGNMARLVN